MISKFRFNIVGKPKLELINSEDQEYTQRKSYIVINFRNGSTKTVKRGKYKINHNNVAVVESELLDDTKKVKRITYPMDIISSIEEVSEYKTIKTGVEDERRKENQKEV
jgi:hypothetical protein